VTLTIPGYLLVGLVDAIIVIFVLTADHPNPDECGFDVKGLMTLTLFDLIGVAIFALALSDMTRFDFLAIAAVAIGISTACLCLGWLGIARLFGAGLAVLAMLTALVKFAAG